MHTTDPLPTQLQARLQRLLGDALPGSHLTVAYSGGVDSAVLLHGLAALAPALGFRLSAAHVHHGLSPNADAWASICERTCAGLNIPLQVFRVQVDQQSAKGLEAAARSARYAALENLKCDWIVLAHHRGDQAETLLFRLVRGAGVTGAAAMRDIDPSRRLLRPLLDVPRAALEAYASENALVWIEDESNRDGRFARNFLRHQVLTPIAQKFPGVEANLVRATRHFREASELLADLAAEDMQRLNVSQPGSRTALRALSAPRARNLLRYLLAQRGEQAPDEARLHDALKQMCADAHSARTVVGGSALCAYRDRVWLEAAGVIPAPCTWTGERVLPWADGSVRFTPAIGNKALMLSPTGGLQLGLRSGGERLRVHPGGPSRAFKQLCQEAGIPPWLRERMPMLRQGEKVLWIGGLDSDSAMRCAEGEPGWEIEWDVAGRSA